MKDKTTKADDKVTYFDEDEKKEVELGYSNFEELKERVKLLQETLDNIVSILRANNLSRTEVYESQYFDEDKLYDNLNK